MPTEGFLKPEDWDEFNSSLLIEVTRTHGVFTCTGVAVSPEIIVTAAHCLEGDVIKVRIFTQSFYDPTSASLPIKRFKVHPSYRPKKSRYKSDLAKIILQEKLPSTIKILPIFQERIVVGEILRFGFGERNKKNLRTAILPKLKRMDLENMVIELNDKFSYQGDSGGPIYLKRDGQTFVLAIHSTLSFGPEGKFSYNPLLSNFHGWIFEN